jgi:hypothetical protein
LWVVEVLGVSNISDALRRAGWLWLLPLVAWLAIWIPDLNNVVQTGILALFVFSTGVVVAIALPAHPLRNGTVAGTAAFLIGTVLAIAVGWMLGHAPGPGQTWGQALVEMPSCLLITSPFAAVVALVGAGLAVRLTPRPAPG